MKHFKKLFIFFLVFISFTPINAKEKIHVYLFYTQQCPHCSNEIAWLDSEYENDEEVELIYFELSDIEHQVIFNEVQDFLNEPARGVPYLVIEDEVFVGFMFGITDEEISAKIQNIKKGSYLDPLGLITKTRTENITGEKLQDDKKFKIPILGEVSAQTVSLPLLASIMGLVDGFNPCAMWVLVFLITMMLQMENRKRMWILGLTFIFTSGFIYYLFMFTWLNVAMFLSKIKFIQTLIAVFACVFGLYSLYTFFKSYKDVGCEVIDTNHRNKIMLKVKRITENHRLFISLLSVISLAVLINLFELMCSLGLPVVFTQILSLNNLNSFQTQAYLMIYLFFFVIDDLIIFFIAMKTLKIKGISNKYAKLSHLIGGMIMIVLSLLMLLRPEWLMMNF